MFFPPWQLWSILHLLFPPSGTVHILLWWDERVLYCYRRCVEVMLSTFLMITIMLPTVTHGKKSVSYSHTEEEQTVAPPSVLLKHNFLDCTKYLKITAIHPASPWGRHNTLMWDQSIVCRNFAASQRFPRQFSSLFSTLTAFCTSLSERAQPFSDSISAPQRTA